MEWMRSWLAMPFNNSMSVSIINFKSREISRRTAKAKNENCPPAVPPTMQLKCRTPTMLNRPSRQRLEGFHFRAS
jgi:hypothetical protein